MNNTLLYYQHFRVGSTFFGRTKKTVSVAKREVDWKKIRWIVILDQWTDGTGGRAWITSGGVGSKSVRFDFEAQLFRGMEFEIILYGKVGNSFHSTNTLVLIFLSTTFVLSYYLIEF